MKNIFSVIFYTLAGAAFGFALGAYFGKANQLLVLIPALVGAVLMMAAILLTTLLVRDHHNIRNASVNLQKKDVVLQVGQVYTVGKRGKIHPGEYKVIATDENEKQFNLRINDYVKEYRHNTTLVLVEGDTISPRSANVILR